MSRWVVALGLAACVAAASAQPKSVDPTGRPVLMVGEELEYRVSYSFFHIGTIRTKVTDRWERDGRVIYRAEVLMDSDPALSWLVDLHMLFRGTIDGEAFSYTWLSEDSTSTGVDFRTMEFDYPRGKMYYAWGRRPHRGSNIVAGRDTVPIRDRSVDGMSLLFFARENARHPRTWRIPTFVDNREGITEFFFRDKREDLKIDAVEYPVRTVWFDGTAKFVGVFGLTGGFEAWFSDDEARIPIVGRLKVILGSVKVELIKWKRGSWAPPRGKG
ncbi:MAG: DUF3108 domain-containing protein [Bacteroidetes bacterium]|nr:DUF3108 domain-containing protein [Bacteroidota bacterium]